MKLRSKYSAIAIFCLICTGCINHSIKKAAYEYLDAVANYDFEAAEPYVTEETCDVTLAFFKDIMPMVDTNYVKSNTPAEIKIKGVVRQSDSTAAVAYHKSTPITQQDDTIYLVRQEGKWLVKNVIEIPPFFQMMRKKGKH